MGRPRGGPRCGWGGPGGGPAVVGAPQPQPGPHRRAAQAQESRPKKPPLATSTATYKLP